VKNFLKKFINLWAKHQNQDKSVGVRHLFQINFWIILDLAFVNFRFGQFKAFEQKPLIFEKSTALPLFFQKNCK